VFSHGSPNGQARELPSGLVLVNQSPPANASTAEAVYGFGLAVGAGSIGRQQLRSDAGASTMATIWSATTLSPKR
jgi:hypothetical protein